MPFERRVWGELVAMGIISGLVAFGLAYATGHRGFGQTATSRVAPGSKLEARDASFVVEPGAGRFSVKSTDDQVTRTVEVSLMVDGVVQPIALGSEAMRAGEGDELRAQFPVDLGGESADAQLAFRVDKDASAMVVELRMKGDKVRTPHSVGLQMDLPSNGQVLFVSGVGEIADRTNVSGFALVVDSDPHPMGLVSSRGPLAIATIVDDPNDSTDDVRISATSPAVTLPSPGLSGTDLRFALGASSARLWRSLYRLAGISTARVHGKVTGTGERAHVFGRDSDGVPQVRVTTDADGAFDLEAPTPVVEWYAAIDAARASALGSYTPGAPHPLVLDVSPGGELKVMVVDADSGDPITARLAVRGLESTVDPSFGPDYRATGAGPLIDALKGAVTTPLPSGKYRVLATKGIEWSVDFKDVEIAPGHTVEVKLSPRHVVPTPNIVGCDLHVHSRPSFDSPVSVEDRVLSLVGAGIDFAVPTEHNVVGDYASAIDTLDFVHEFASVTGVEVTTLGGGFGHFGVFPYPKGTPVPPYRHVSMAMMTNAIRAGDPKRYYQLNHPRLPKGIGYFTNIGFYPTVPKDHLRGRFDYDGIEVYNGYDIETLPRVEQVLKDYHALLNLGYRHVATGSSDSHRIQYHWAGYPRTMVSLDGTDKIDEHFDPLQVVAQIKKGHMTVTSGPIIELTLGNVHPGDEIFTADDPITGHLRVRAAPWLDVSSIQIIVNGKMVQNFPVETRPSKIGTEEGTLQEASDRTIRFDQDISVDIGEPNGWVQIVVRGDRKMDDVLPFMPVQPFGFTNPIWITRHAVPLPPMILQGPPPAKSGAPAVPHAP